MDRRVVITEHDRYKGKLFLQMTTSSHGTLTLKAYKLVICYKFLLGKIIKQTTITYDGPTIRPRAPRRRRHHHL